MIIIKPVFKILLLATLSFTLIVFLGLKFQWGSHLQRVENKPIPLPIPELITTPATIAVEQKPEFQPEIMNGNQMTAFPLANMTKNQIIGHCKALAEKLYNDDAQSFLFVGNCVVSNYRDPIQNVSNIQLNQQMLRQKKEREKNCRNQTSHENGLLAIDKMLLLGICVLN